MRTIITNLINEPNLQKTGGKINTSVYQFSECRKNGKTMVAITIK